LSVFSLSVKLTLHFFLCCARVVGSRMNCQVFHPPSTNKENPMSEFIDVTVVKKANSYFDGRVTSRTIKFNDGSRKTLGIMQPGDYEFGTAEKEIMEILAGELEILLPGAETWQQIKGGESFEVPANAKFSLKVKTLTDYCCSYINE